MKDFEKLGLFYLGRRHDLATGKTSDEPILYDSRDLLTHGVCVGMTGSGKTGLCISIIEEAALDNVPVIAIDPKGDLGNLLLTFPRLAAEDFRPWIDEDEARRAGVGADEYAAQQAQVWSRGLAEWGQDGRRIERLRAAADFAIYTPGSVKLDIAPDALQPISSSERVAFAPLPAAAVQPRNYASWEKSFARWIDQAERLQQRTQTAVSFGATVLGALLGRKAVSTGTLGRATTAARGVSRSMKEAADVKRATETVEAVRAQIRALEEEAGAEAAAIGTDFDVNATLDKVVVAPKRGQIDVAFVALGWMVAQEAPSPVLSEHSVQGGSKDS